MSLRTLITEVQRACIRAAMHENGLTYGSCDEGGFHGTYNLVPLDHEREPIGGFNPVELFVSYPGGEWYVDYAGQRIPFSQTSYNAYDLPFEPTEVFESCRSVVAEILDPWLNVPQTGDFDDAMASLNTAAYNLLADGVFTDGDGTEQTLDGGSLALNDWVKYADDELTQYNGAMIEALDAQYVSRLRPTLSGQFIVASGAGTVVAGEQEIWRIANEEILEIATAAKEAFDAISERGEVDWKKVLQVVGAVAGAASLFVTGPGALVTAITATRTISGIMTTFMPDPPPAEEATISGRSVQDVCDSLSTATGKLATSVGDAESALLSFGIRMDGYVSDNRAYFDISITRDVRSFLEDDGAAYFAAGENLEVLTPHLREIAPRFSLIAESQRTASTAADGASTESRWYRDSALGLSYRGCYAGYSVLEQTLTSLCNNSATELDSVAQRLVEVSYDFDRTDEQIEEEIRRRTDEVRAVTA
ncbi:hypothetical protein [Nocardioides sambongensis]|uniref:hypothetical protein n=1 Tax=Nocardioides sambongensis TaxID=2589074 RepID=UPI001125F06F|nr:hypothetical protein [Nocardioides sambongensis]